MLQLKGLIAYPLSPPEIGSTLSITVETLRERYSIRDISTWEENDIAGRFIVSPILSKIDEGNLLIADITHFNFNVVYEIGYAIGKKKRVFLVRNANLICDKELIREVGIFDTLGYQEYSNS